MRGRDSDGVGNGSTTGTEITDSVYLNLSVYASSR